MTVGGCPAVTEYFAKGTAPTQYCNVHPDVVPTPEPQPDTTAGDTGDAAAGTEPDAGAEPAADAEPAAGAEDTSGT